MSRCGVCPLWMKAGVSQVHRRVIRSFCRGIGFPHRLRSVPLVYQIFPAIREESLNDPERNCNQKSRLIRRLFYALYAGYKLLISSRMGSAKVNTLMDQA